MRLVAARCDADLVERAPKAIAATRVVMAQIGGALSGGGADEYEAEARLKLVGKLFQSSALERESAWGATVARLPLMVDGGYATLIHPMS